MMGDRVMSTDDLDIPTPGIVNEGSVSKSSDSFELRKAAHAGKNTHSVSFGLLTLLRTLTADANL